MGVWSYNYLSSGILAAKYLAESLQSIMIELMGTLRRGSSELRYRPVGGKGYF